MCYTLYDQESSNSLHQHDHKQLSNVLLTLWWVQCHEVFCILCNHICYTLYDWEFSNSIYQHNHKQLSNVLLILWWVQCH